MSRARRFPSWLFVLALGTGAVSCAKAPSAPAAVSTTPPVTSATPPSRQPPKNAGTKAPLHVVAIGAHPDDPESGCGGTLLRLRDAGHRVTVLYMTRGETEQEPTGARREKEARVACGLLGATPVFFGERGGAFDVNGHTAAALGRTLRELAPDVVYTHWPLDTHHEHQATGILTLRAVVEQELRASLYFYEVESGTQTIGFSPTVFVDISNTRDRKLAALKAHESQNPEERIYDRHHAPMERFRGREIGARAAEAFVVLAPTRSESLIEGLP
jgi:LmbE family N-acetylglucosaminyl deacetylase